MSDKLIELKEFLSDGNVFFPDGEENTDLLNFLKIFDEPSSGDEESPISFSDLKEYIINLDKLWSIDEVSDQFFEKLAYLLHYEFDDRYTTVAEAREVLKDIIYDYQRKGSIRSYRAIAILLSIDMWVYNNVHKVVVPSVQGQLSGYSKDQQKICTDRTKELLPANIYHHEGYIQDNRNIHEGVVDIIFTFTKYYDRLKSLLINITPAGLFPRYTERSEEEISLSCCSFSSRTMSIIDADVNVFDLTFKNDIIGFNSVTTRDSFCPKASPVNFGNT